MVPMASKKLASTRVKTSSVAARAPTRVKAPTGSTSPTIDRSGSPPSESGMPGTASDQPPSFSAEEPAPTTASTTMASTVVATMPMNNPPRTLRTTSAPQMITPMTKTSVGKVPTEPPSPSETGTVVCAASGTRVTKPASTRPIIAMNAPMPTPMAAFIGAGMALKTASRKPEMASRTMTMPSTTTRPIASGQVRPSPATRVTATIVLMPRPAAMPKG